MGYLIKNLSNNKELYIGEQWTTIFLSNRLIKLLRSKDPKTRYLYENE